jgi:iron-sulfur cluster assembly protein
MEENTITYQVHISDSALEQIKKQFISRGTPNSYLRLGVRGGGCSGFSYALQYEDKDPSVKDLIFHFGEIKVIVDKKSIIYLNNCTLDWEKSLMYQGFKFVNPNESSKCGCGTSFSV